MKRARFFYLWAALALLVCIASSLLAIGQCAIRPIKPIPPIGCKDVTPECVSDSNGKSHWNWICVPDNAGADTSNKPAWKPNAQKLATPSRANVNTTPHNPVITPFQEPTSAIRVPIGEMGAGEQQATGLLQAVADEIKSCPPRQLPPGIVDPLAAEGFEDVYGPPLNVVWNVQSYPSIRSRYAGSIEFSEPSYFRPPLDDAYCNKPKINKGECRRRWLIGMRMYQQQADHPRQFRYEFDVTDHGLELLRVFEKNNRTDDDPWVAGNINSDACASKAIQSVLNNPNNAAQTSPPPALSAPALPLAATQASLSIESTPSGADIEIDGAFVGNTPSTVNVGPGSHQIVVKKKGFTDWTKPLNVTGGTVHLNAELEQEQLKQ